MGKFILSLLCAAITQTALPKEIRWDAGNANQWRVEWTNPDQSISQKIVSLPTTEIPDDAERVSVCSRHPRYFEVWGKPAFLDFSSPKPNHTAKDFRVIYSPDGLNIYISTMGAGLMKYNNETGKLDILRESKE